ncbi:MAG: hypothetical protein EU536_01675 [Promethearchaeota archaeon]|nr:MAG: hypothetical protein EU536_01675 [Candidatus Lokiarchaeota archaeon]
MSEEKKASSFMQILEEAKDVYSFLDRIKETYPKFIEMSKDYNLLKEENARMKDELQHVSKELAKVSKEFEYLTKERTDKIDMREILTLSMTLLTEVFGAQPHSKLLFLLHGQKEQWTRNDLVKSSGISAAAIRKALADLAAAKLVEYDVETGDVKLLKRLY